MQNKPSNIQITSSKIQFTPPQTFKYDNELQKQSYIMKNKKKGPHLILAGILGKLSQIRKVHQAY